MLFRHVSTWHHLLARPLNDVHRFTYTSGPSYWPKRSLQTNAVETPLSFLPRSCPGCGAYSHISGNESAGCYSPNRKSIRSYLEQLRPVLAPRTTGDEQAASSSPDGPLDYDPGAKQAPPPICDRCHGLLHHATGNSLEYPSIESINTMLSVSPYKHNHIYHVLDAADFPMSLIPDLQRRLALNPQRSKNRRSRARRFYHGHMRDVSFIIARSDLLASQKTHVDRLMPYLVQVLRDALNSSADNVRLGNIRCVSAMRGWWTTQLKTELWERGGAGWLVGKVNVGKSNLLQSILPKGRMLLSDRSVAEAQGADPQPLQQRTKYNLGEIVGGNSSVDEGDELGPRGLLPPAPIERNYPVLPIVSQVPGTTAAPVRIPYGNQKGEIIDLPGVKRGSLAAYVEDEHSACLIMRDRPNPQQRTIKPSESLMIQGLICVTPLTPHVTFLAYPFVPLTSHIVSSQRQLAIDDRSFTSGHRSFLKPGTAESLKSAGRFTLRWDVTMQRAGSLTEKDGAGLSVNALPFAIFSADILIEGTGWIELVAQVRKRDLEEDAGLPQIEVYSPHGLHIGIRRPMNASLWIGQHSGRGPLQKRRPRKSLKGSKEISKRAQRKPVV